VIEFQNVFAHRPHARAGLGRGLAALLALALAVSPVPAAHAADTLIDLGTLPGGFSSFPGGINSDGQVTGGADTSSGTAYRVFVWDPAAGLQNVGTLGGNAFGNAINAGGTVTGHSALSQTGIGRFQDRAFRLTPGGGMQNLGTLPGGSISRGYGIDATGQIVGESNAMENGALVFRATLWPVDGSPQSLGTLPGGGSSVAYAINDGGQVVGQVADASGNTKAFVWTAGGGMQDLGTLPGGTVAVARGINGLGRVAGWSGNASGARRAVVWDQATGLRDLGTLPGGPESMAYGINDAGTVVGLASLADGSVRAVVWTATGAIRDLGTLPGGSFSVAYGINLANEVVGQSTTVEGEDHAVRWQLDRPPVASSLSMTTPQDTAVAVTLTGSDPDGDAVTFIVVTGPTHGSLSGTPPALTYTPATGFSGSDTFTFKLVASGADSNLATVSLAVSAAPTPPTSPPGGDLDGRMKGQGLVDAGDTRGAFELKLRPIAATDGGYGQLVFRRWTPGDRGDEEEAVRDGRAVDRFVSTSVAAVTFSDDPALRAGRRPASVVVDSAAFSGEGRWNGQPGYTFEATATDAGEPGVGRDTFAVTIKSPSGEVVATAGGTLTGGNIQSKRPALPAPGGAVAKKSK
jgi:probable HAF family extracellular repeat protein